MLSRLAKSGSSAVICEIMNDDGTVWRKVDSYLILQKNINLRIGKIDDLIAYRLNREKLTKFKKTLNSL